jgi:alpha-ketoglutarate-dependent taurine dioxygenase
MVMNSTAIEAARQNLNLRGWALISGSDAMSDCASAIETVASHFGSPSDRDGGITVWPISPRKADGTFSETAGEAHLHTDAQYHAVPERLIFLACARPSETGGESVLLDVPGLKRTLEEADFSPAEMKILKSPLWRWRVPKVFQTPLLPEVSEAKPILDHDKIRWRYDNLVTESPELRHLADAFHRTVEGSKFKQILTLKRGDFLICDNERALHGRNAFTDAHRLLFRVRLQ